MLGHPNPVFDDVLPYPGNQLWNVDLLFVSGWWTRRLSGSRERERERERGGGGGVSEIDRGVPLSVADIISLY